MRPAIPNRFHFYPRTSANRQPTPWWYYGRAVYVSRRDYFKIYCALMLVLGIPMAFVGLYFDWTFFKVAALGGGTVSLFYLGYSLLGLYRMYGHPGKSYVQQLLKKSRVGSPTVVADLHIGTYRHAYVLSELLPDATIHSIDCWGADAEPHEIAIRDVRDLESIPQHHSRIHPMKADQYRLPLNDESCDVVVMGFGTHEIPKNGPLELLFTEARRVLKPGGKLLMFEHGNDFHNVIIFGPVIGHVVPRYEWAERFQKQFGDVGYHRTSQAVDLFWGTKSEVVGTNATVLPKPASRRTIWIFVVIAAFTLISLGVVAFLPTAQLIPIYWLIAISGLTWPWLAIALALIGERMTHASMITSSPEISIPHADTHSSEPIAPSI